MEVLGVMLPWTLGFVEQNDLGAEVWNAFS